MPWQKITKHINDHRVEVQSKSGNNYPVNTPRDYQNQSIYKQMMNRANDGKTLWAWVDFDGDNPTLEDVSTGSPYGGPPENPPWEHP